MTRSACYISARRARCRKPAERWRKNVLRKKKNRRALKRLFTTHCCSLAPSEQIHRAACRSEGGKIESIAVKVSSVSVLYLTSWVPVRWTVWWLYKKSLYWNVPCWGHQLWDINCCMCVCQSVRQHIAILRQE